MLRGGKVTQIRCFAVPTAKQGSTISTNFSLGGRCPPGAPDPPNISAFGDTTVDVDHCIAEGGNVGGVSGGSAPPAKNYEYTLGTIYFLSCALSAPVLLESFFLCFAVPEPLAVPEPFAVSKAKPKPSQPPTPTTTATTTATTALATNPRTT